MQWISPTLGYDATQPITHFQRPFGTHPTTLGEATNQAGLPYALTPWYI